MATPAITRTMQERAPLSALLTANVISQIGSAFTLIAIPWFVLQTTGSAAKTGLTGVFAALPFVIAGAFGGALVDRVGFKRASILSDVTSGLAVALVPLLYHTIGLAFWQLLALSFLGNLLNSPGSTARSSLVPELGALAGMRLERANAVVQAVPRVAMLLGPPLAGILITILGTSNVLWLDAASFAFSAALIALLVPNIARTKEPNDAPRRYFADLAAGLRFIRGERLIRALCIIFAVGNFFDAPLSLLVAVYVQRVYGSAVPLGGMFSTLGAGAVIGSLAYGAVGHRVPRRAILALYSLPVAAMYAAFAFTPPLPVLLAIIFVDGLAVGPLNPLSATITQERTPVAYRGRVQGMITSLAWVAIPLGRGLAGLLIAPLGLPAIFLGIAGGFLLIGAAIAFVPVFRDMSAPAEQSTPLSERAVA